MEYIDKHNHIKNGQNRHNRFFLLLNVSAFLYAGKWLSKGTFNANLPDEQKVIVDEKLKKWIARELEGVTDNFKHEIRASLSYDLVDRSNDTLRKSFEKSLPDSTIHVPETILGLMGEIDKLLTRTIGRGEAAIKKRYAAIEAIQTAADEIASVKINLVDTIRESVSKYMDPNKAFMDIEENRNHGEDQWRYRADVDMSRQLVDVLNHVASTSGKCEITDPNGGGKKIVELENVTFDMEAAKDLYKAYAALRRWTDKFISKTYLGKDLPKTQEYFDRIGEEFEAYNNQMRNLNNELDNLALERPEKKWISPDSETLAATLRSNGGLGIPENSPRRQFFKVDRKSDEEGFGTRKRPGPAIGNSGPPAKKTVKFKEPVMQVLGSVGTDGQTDGVAAGTAREIEPNPDYDTRTIDLTR